MATQPVPPPSEITVEEYLTTVYRPDCDYVDGHIEERNLGEKKHSKIQGWMIGILLQRVQGDIDVLPEMRVQITPSRFRIPDVCLAEQSDEQILTKPPLLCVEVLSPEDRMSRVQARIREYFAMGVPCVWVLDPETRQAFISTPAEGLREVKNGVLTTANPPLEVRLDEVFR